MNDAHMVKLNVPEKLAVGFQKRTDTYSGKLAYITYLRKDKVAKELSWNGWRDKSIEPTYTDNTPTEGFVLNKHVGGCKSWWNFRQSYCRIWDPRGFEFEITIPNLLYILETCNCLKGKGLEGKFVYAWDGKDLVLLPVDTEEYRQSVSLQDATVNIKGDEIKVGYGYRCKDDDKTLYYIGRLYVPRMKSVKESKEQSPYRGGYTMFYRDTKVNWYGITHERLHCFVDESRDRVYWYPDFKKFYYRLDDHISQLEVNDIITSLKARSIYEQKPDEVTITNLTLNPLSAEEKDLIEKYFTNHERMTDIKDYIALWRLRRKKTVYQLYRTEGKYGEGTKFSKVCNRYKVDNPTEIKIADWFRDDGTDAVYDSLINDSIEVNKHYNRTVTREDIINTISQLTFTKSLSEDGEIPYWIEDNLLRKYEYYYRRTNDPKVPSGELIAEGTEYTYYGPYLVLSDGTIMEPGDFVKTGGYTTIKGINDKEDE